MLVAELPSKKLKTAKKLEDAATNSEEMAGRAALALSQSTASNFAPSQSTAISFPALGQSGTSSFPRSANQFLS